MRAPADAQPVARAQLADGAGGQVAIGEGEAVRTGATAHAQLEARTERARRQRRLGQAEHERAARGVGAEQTLAREGRVVRGQVQLAGHHRGGAVQLRLRLVQLRGPGLREAERDARPRARLLRGRRGATHAGRVGVAVGVGAGRCVERGRVDDRVAEAAPCLQPSLVRVSDTARTKGYG